MKKKVIEPVSVKEVIDRSVLNDETYTREEIKVGLERDLKGVFALLSTLLQTPDAIEALTENFWQRYQALQKKKAVEMQIDFAKAEEVPGNAR